MTEDIIAKPLEEQVFRTLEEEILSGERAPGTSLSEVAVGERLGVSRTPVRAALHRLKEEGLVEIVPHKGAKVIGVSIDEVMSTYYIRMRLEGLAVRMAIERLTEEEISALTRFVELSEYYSTKGDADKLKDMDTEFHALIYKSSGSRMLTRILSELHRNVKAYRRLWFNDPIKSRTSRNEHKEILDAIVKKDPDLAEELMLKHVEHAMENMTEYVKTRDKV